MLGQEGLKFLLGRTLAGIFGSIGFLYLGTTRTYVIGVLFARSPSNSVAMFLAILYEV